MCSLLQPVTVIIIFLSKLATDFLELPGVFSGKGYLLLIANIVDKTRIENTISAIDTKTTEYIFSGCHSS